MVICNPNLTEEDLKRGHTTSFCWFQGDQFWQSMSELFAVKDYEKMTELVIKEDGIEAHFIDTRFGKIGKITNEQTFYHN